MNRQDVLRLYPQLKVFLHYLKIANLFFITLVIILYIVSVYCLLKGQMVLAIVLATFAVLLFHLSQKYLLTGLTFLLYRNKENRAMVDFLDGEMDIKIDKMKGSDRRNKEKEFLLLLAKVMEIVDKK